MADVPLTAVSIKRKSSNGQLTFKVSGTNFPLDGTLEVRANGELVKLKSDDIDESGFTDTKVKPKNSPPAGTQLHFVVVGQNGIRSNDFLAVVP